ncbi:MAG: biopolymer transporter ExbD [Planctomycetes bacterium]|nr:biopolymer transporter ExbD [Planctomycetota bacterium]
MAISVKAVSDDPTIHYEPPRKKRSRGKPDMQPPMTPMIDVTFQLLLFFLLACDFREMEGNIPGTLPSRGNLIQQVEQTPPPDPIQIRLRPSHNRASANYELTGVSVVINSPEELYGYLKARQDRLGPAGRKVPVVIFPSPDVPWQFVVEAFNQAVRAKFEKIGFAQQIM